MATDCWAKVQTGKNYKEAFDVYEFKVDYPQYFHGNVNSITKARWTWNGTGILHHVEGWTDPSQNGGLTTYQVVVDGVLMEHTIPLNGQSLAFCEYYLNQLYENDISWV
jgi:hypothetical protein